MSSAPKRRLGDILVERGFVTEEQLARALQSGKRLGEALLEMGAVGADELNWALSELLGIPYVEFRDEMVDLELARTMPEEVLRRHLTFPVLRVDRELTVIMADPTNRQGILELETLTGCRVTVAIAAREAIQRLLDRAFPAGAGGAAGFGAEAGVDGAEVYRLLAEAVGEGASELHLEPLGAEVRLRYRVDGRLVERGRLGRAEAAALLARFRALAGLSTAGLPARAVRRTRLGAQDLELDLLVFPSLEGETLSVRIWQGSAEVPGLDAFAVGGAPPGGVGALAAAPGLVVATGPDPRARAALLYALAAAGAAPDRRVLTVERAASYVVPGYVQVELPGPGWGAAAGLLAHPADVVLVEDLAARELAQAAVDCAEQGALVLGGLAVGRGRSALVRLVGAGVPAVALAGVLRGVLHVAREGTGYRVEAIGPEGCREALLRGEAGSWTSPTS